MVLAPGNWRKAFPEVSQPEPFGRREISSSSSSFGEIADRQGSALPFFDSRGPRPAKPSYVTICQGKTASGRRRTAAVSRAYSGIDPRPPTTAAAIGPATADDDPKGSSPRSDTVFVRLASIVTSRMAGPGPSAAPPTTQRAGWGSRRMLPALGDREHPVPLGSRRLEQAQPHGRMVRRATPCSPPVRFDLDDE